MNAITSCYADLPQKESGWTDTPKKTLHIWLIGPILCLGRSLAIEPQNSYLSRNWTVFTPWKFFPPRSLLELVQLAIAFYDEIKFKITYGLLSFDISLIFSSHIQKIHNIIKFCYFQIISC